MSEGLRRRNVAKEESISNPRDETKNDSNSDSEGLYIDDKETRLTLMEEVLLVGFKDQEGYTSFWNDKISSGLRGCILIELAFRDRIALGGLPNNGINRPVCVMSTASTGDQLLDEAIRTISSSLPNLSVSRIIEYLSGESWNIMMISSQMRNVRERVAKGLVDKGILTTERVNYLIVDFTTHPLIKYEAKSSLIKRLHDVLVHHWPNHPSRLKKHDLALILLTHYSDVLEDILITLPENQYRFALKNIDQLVALNFSELVRQDSKYALMWAVFHALAKN